MKKLKQILPFLVASCCFIFACNFSHTTVQNSKHEFSVIATVDSIQFGKDGYTAFLTTKDKATHYNAVISRVNMQDKYVSLQKGDKITVYGDTTKIGDAIFIKATRIEK